jgi:chorismate mutase
MHYASEVLSRRAQGKTKDRPISHDITPDILVWCSSSFPKGKDKPRLEAYVCMPSERENVERGEIIQSTKKHTTQVSESDMLNWLENIYPLSYVQQRSTDAKSVEEDTKQIKIEISIREEIIDHYTPSLRNKNIALKTLWYLYPDLSNKYTGSDYQVLTEMMHTVIGQQRVCDITSESIEELLLEVYPNINETALWRNYKILSIAMEKAKAEKYCAHNPLEDALREEKLRRKLFAQVRKNMVKKHLEKPELKLAYREIVSKIKDGQYEYIGVLIRLLTGLESGIVCALRWRDMVQYPCFNVAALAIIRQVSNDGKEISGFSDSEDYIHFPLSDGLRARLEEFQKKLGDIPDDTRILDSIVTLSSGAGKPLTPSRLNDLTKGILSKFKVEDNYYNIAYGNNEFRKTNLNKYMGDFIRENFRYWANKEAKLLPAELSVLLRNRVDSTCGRFYCDLQNEASLAIIAAKLSRMECLFMQAEQPVAQRAVTDRVYEYESEVMPQNGYRQKVFLEFLGDSMVEVCAHSPRGIWSSATNLTDKEGKPI